MSQKEEEERKKWYIDRIEKTLETIMKQVESERAQNKSEADRIEIVYTTWRNRFLTASTFAATVILGLSALWEEFKLEFMLPLLTADVVAGIIPFIVFTLIKGKIHGYIL
jgi:hypothetical protein